MAFFDWLNARYKELERYHAATDIPLNYPAFIAVIFFASVVVAYLSFSVVTYLPPAYKVNTAVISLVLFAGIASFMLSFPISSRASRIAAIDKALPDALKYMAVILRAGGTTESALEEISKAGYGPLSKDIAVAFKGLREGRTFDEVFIDTAQTGGSALFTHCATIIIDARRAGAGLADVIDAIADDSRDMLRIKRERISRTTMHTVFLIVASLLLAPFIFGFTISIINFIGVSITGAIGEMAAAPGEADAATGNISRSVARALPIAAGVNIDLDLLLTVFITIQAVVTAIAIGIIREGKPLHFVMQIPLMILAALFVYMLGKWLSSLAIVHA